MAADIKQKFGTATTITVTLASLADAAKRESTVVDNTSDLFLDAHVQIKVKSGASVSGDKAVYVYAYASLDSSSPGYSGEATGSDAAYTGTLTNAKMIGIVSCPAATTSYISDLMSIAAAFGGSVPTKWGIIVENKTGAALDSTEANHVKKYIGILVQSL